jgi:hypothetical protein
MTTQDRIKALEDQMEALGVEQAALRKQLVDAEAERWQERIDDLEVQLHLAAMDTNDKIAALVQQLRKSWAVGRAELERRSSAASEGAESVRDSLRNAFTDIRKAVLETTHKLAS